mmetsp:Transcript_40149/g.75285  ORF Transcript_40149/g.75285 Transcript_40149/m.75285 type:complete len:237 (-) Transcript_40149:87-797(-)
MTPLLVGEPDFHLQVESPWPEQRRVYEVLAVGSTHNQHVVETVYTIHLGQQGVYDAVVHLVRSFPSASPPRLHQRIKLVEHDEVHPAGRAFPLRGVLLRVLEQRAHLQLGLPQELGHHLRPVHHLGRVRVKHLANLPGHRGLAAARRPVEQNASDVLDSQRLRHRSRHHAAHERATHYGLQLLVQAAYAVVLEPQILTKHLHQQGQSVHPTARYRCLSWKERRTGTRFVLRIRLER